MHGHMGETIQEAWGKGHVYLYMIHCMVPYGTHQNYTSTVVGLTGSTGQLAEDVDSESGSSASYCPNHTPFHAPILYLHRQCSARNWSTARGVTLVAVQQPLEDRDCDDGTIILFVYWVICRHFRPMSLAIFDFIGLPF